MSKIQRPKIKDLCRMLDQCTVPQTAEKWDNVGLLSGDPDAPYRGGVVSIDLTEDAIATAVKRGASLIVNHHPAVFPKSRGLTSFTPEGRSKLLYKANRAGIAVYSAHTNFDQVALDAMVWLSSELGFTPVGRLSGEEEAPLRKLVVFVPKSHHSQVATALFQAGAGEIGNYDSCGFSIEGTGTFRGSKETKPFLGKPGTLESVQEIRLETVFPVGLKKQVLSALRASHPYEEIAYDIYRVEQRALTEKSFVAGLGYGFIGEAKKAVPMSEFMERVYRVFRIDAAMSSLPHAKSVKRMAFSPGKGSSFVAAASDAGCDVFVTGETGYHDSREGALKGLQVIEVGHRESEIAFLVTLEKWLKPFGKVEVIHRPVQRIVRRG